MFSGKLITTVGNGLDGTGDAGRTAHSSQCYTNSRVVTSLELAHEGRPSGKEVQMLWGNCTTVVS